MLLPPLLLLHHGMQQPCVPGSRRSRGACVGQQDQMHSPVQEGRLVLHDGTLRKAGCQGILRRQPTDLDTRITSAVTPVTVVTL